MDVTQKAHSARWERTPQLTHREQPSPSADPANSFGQVFRRLSTEVDRGEHAVHSALRISPTDENAGMIALQAGVYRYVEAVELCTKLVDRSTNAVKTTLQSQ